MFSFCDPAVGGGKNKRWCEDSWDSFPPLNNGLATELRQTSSWHWKELGCVPFPFKRTLARDFRLFFIKKGPSEHSKDIQKLGFVTCFVFAKICDKNACPRPRSRGLR